MGGSHVEMSDIPRKLLRASEECQIWTDDQGWVSLKPNSGYQNKGYGPEFGLAATLVNKGIDALGFIKLAQSQSTFEADWLVNDGLVEQVVSSAKDAMQENHAVLRGIFLIAGETDALSEELANKYSANLEKLIEQLRACLGLGSLPIISTVISAGDNSGEFSKIVQHAQQNSKISNYSSMSLDRFETVDGTALLKGSALGRVGRRLALLYSDILLENQNNLSTQKWLWRGDNLEAWLDVPVDCKNLDSILLAFPFAVIGDGMKDAPFGREVFSSKKIPTIYIRSKVSRWFQSEETFEMCSAIREAIGSHTKLIAYGASMGAYGALLTSKALNTSEILAVAPQYSINRAEVPWETRWAKAIPRIGAFKFSMNEHLSDTAKVTVIFDPKSQDQKQVDLFRKNKNWHLLKLPYATHQILRFIAETGKISRIPMNFPNSGPDPAHFRREIRANKHNSFIYLSTLADAVLKKRPQLAVDILGKAKNVKGARPRRVREKIEGIQRKFKL